MLDARKQVDLIRLLGSNQNLLRLVSFFRWEYTVGFSSRDGQRARDSCKLVLINKGWVSYIANLDPILVVADNILEVGKFG